jgi:predicted O-methyltransferase YrrM
LLPQYRATSDIPPRVREALALAETLGFAHSCQPEVGRLLRVLSASVGHGTVAELGTGCGAGAAWIMSGLRPGVSFVTVERDEARAAAARELFRDDPRVEVITGDWRVILDRAPFALLFADGGNAKQHEPAVLLESLAPGGIVVLDDLTPEDQWPAEWRGRPDPVRAFWLNDPRLHAIELLPTPSSAVIVATRS